MIVNHVLEVTIAISLVWEIFSLLVINTNVHLVIIVQLALAQNQLLAWLELSLMKVLLMPSQMLVNFQLTA